MRYLLAAFISLTCFATLAAEENARWLWSSKEAKDEEVVHFRKTFSPNGPVRNAVLTVTADNIALIYLNGERLGRAADWKDPFVLDVTKMVKPSDNLIAIKASNEDGIAALAAMMTIKYANGKVEKICSDTTWLIGPGEKGWNEGKVNEEKWTKPVELGPMGMKPWGDVFNKTAKGGPSLVTTPEDLKLLPGFTADLIYVVPKAQQGSWVSLTADSKGRLIVSDQGDKGLYRITPNAPGADLSTTKIEHVDIELSAAQGLLYANDSLYVSVNTKKAKHGAGIYRVTDANNDDKLDTITTITKLNGGGEHGPHGLIPGPDGKVYFCAGNHTKELSKYDTYLAPKIWQEDVLLPHHKDPNGHARDVTAPGGWIMRFDPDGGNQTLFSIGFRNEYDIAFNTAGELFSYDADMEWDLGTPWYRPTRICHVTSGSEFGWRTGSGKWPTYYPDSLPPINDIGPGSPTGLLFGTGAKFPAKYQQALFCLDWTYGTVYAVHMTPSGASYTTTREDFIYGKPFPVTDAAIATDGAMYIAIGGRGTQSAIYRIRYTGTEDTAPAAAMKPTPAMLQRRALEAFHGKKDPAAVKAALPELGNTDRFIRYAARTALEHQDASAWADAALAEKNPLARITGIVGLARCGDAKLKDACYNALLAIDPNTLAQPVLFDYIRAVGLVHIRMGAPSASVGQKIAVNLDGLYPSNDAYLNRELAGILAVLGSPMMVSKTIARLGAEELGQDEDMKVLIERNDRYGKAIAGLFDSQPQQQGIQYALALSAATNGWTPDLRKQYFTWFLNAEAKGKGGNSFKGFIRAIQADAMSKVPKAERADYDAKKLSSDITKAPPAEIPVPKGPGKNWTMDELVPLVQNGLSGRNFANGKAMFQATQCIICHRFAGDGAAVGPDITSVGTKFSPRDLLEAIVEPSKVISDQYQTHMVVTKQGMMYIGKLMGEENGQVMVATSPLDLSQLTAVKKDDIVSSSPNAVSIMPPGLLNRLNQDEVLDLIAYLIAAGNADDKVFKP